MSSTKDHILQVALNLFLQSSYKEVTMCELVEKSGMSKGAFYYYFKSKEELFCAVMKMIMDLRELDYGITRLLATRSAAPTPGLTAAALSRRYQSAPGGDYVPAREAWHCPADRGMESPGLLVKPTSYQCCWRQLPLQLEFAGQLPKPAGRRRSLLQPFRQEGELAAGTLPLHHDARGRRLSLGRWFRHPPNRRGWAVALLGPSRQNVRPSNAQKRYGQACSAYPLRGRPQPAV